MKRVDFSSVIKILLSYRSLSESFSHGEFIAELFSAFYEKNDASSDDGQVSRWVNGDERVPERYAAFYSENLNSLCTDILTNIFPVLSDRWQAVNEIRDLVLFDSGISENKKSELLCGLNPDNDYSCAEFTAKVLLFAVSADKSLIYAEFFYPAFACNGTFVGYVHDIHDAVSDVCEHIHSAPMSVSKSLSLDLSAMNAL